MGWLKLLLLFFLILEGMKNLVFSGLKFNTLKNLKVNVNMIIYKVNTIILLSIKFEHQRCHKK